jgi:hypothetical protein
MTERNYYIAVHYTKDNSWVGPPIDGGHSTFVGGVRDARPFTYEEAAAFVDRYENEGWIKWAIYKIDLVSSYKDSPLKRLARTAE